MKHNLLILYFIVFISILTYGQKRGSWGDQGNGTYINPIINADYSDPDVIRVGNKYYMICSEFHYMGMTIQESEDMVNWKIIGRIYNRLDFPAYDSFKRYAGGSWAPAIRFHDNKFWVYFCTINEGLFMTNASNPAGPWSPLLLVKNIEKWEDPCPFWNDDGQAYLGHSVHGAGPIIIHKMSADGTKLLDEGKTVYTGPVAEGTKIYKRNNYYYLSIPEGGVSEGWQTILRSKNIYGPYEKRVVLEKGNTPINGPHQGAIVDNSNGEWWFYHFQSSNALGRVLHLQPMFWHDDWPVIGIDIDRNGIGEPVPVWQKPNVGSTFPIIAPQSDDEFNTEELGLQWQWNHNPIDSNWSLTDKKGWLVLKAKKAANIMEAYNTLTQKVMGNTGEVTVQMDVSNMISGQKTGLSSMSKIYNSIGVKNHQGKLYVFFEGKDKKQEEVILTHKTIYLKLKLDFIQHKNHFFYSTDNKNFKAIGPDFNAEFGYWKGSRIALFSYNELNDGGAAAFNFFHYNYDGPK